MINVIIPCLNEELSIEATIRALQSIKNLISQIIVVDNGSSDRTASIAKRCGAKVVFEQTKGKGFAFRRGLTMIEPNCEIVFLIDGDNTYGVEQISRAADLISNYGIDMVVGSRTKTKNETSYRFGHQFGNRALSYFQNLIFGTNIEDTLSGWRLMSRGFALSFPSGASKFELEAELNSHAFHLSSSVSNLPISYIPRVEGSISKLKTYSDGLRILRRLLNLWRNERPRMAYSFFSIPWLILSAVLFERVLAGYLDSGLVPKFPSLIVAVGSFIICSNFWLAGIILENTNLQRAALARFIFLKESLKINN